MEARLTAAMLRPDLGVSNLSALSDNTPNKKGSKQK